MMKFSLFLAVLSALQLVSPLASAAAFCSLWAGQSSMAQYNVENYRAISEICTSFEGKMFLAIRRFKASEIQSSVVNQTKSADQFILAVDPKTSKTSIVNENCLACSPATQTMLNILPYYQSMIKYTSTPYPIDDDGLTHSETPLNGAIVTVDMCPALKEGFEKDFFESLVKRSKDTSTPTAVGISMTGRWAMKHPNEFQWLKKQNTAHTLDITWINHTFTHPYQPNVPERKNFMLNSKVDFSAEVLNQEKFMIENGELPSVFFRFPGLVSDQALVEKLRVYSLIPVGADAWLALGEKPKPGSIILVHGNLNEPLGIKLFSNLTEKIWPDMYFYSLFQAL